MPDRNDPEIRAFVALSRAGSYSEMAADCLARFGAERAWPAALLAEVRREVRPPRPGTRSPAGEDSEVMAFIEDRADLVALDALVSAGRARFGRSRFPSRSALHRLIQQIREGAPQSGLQSESEAKHATAPRGAPPAS
jgi:hypothetical protein